MDDIFHFEGDKQSFEDLGMPNGVTHWTEAVLREALGYSSGQAFQKCCPKSKASLPESCNRTRRPFQKNG